MHGVIPTRTAIYNRRLDIDVVCPLCSHELETLKHLFCECMHVAPLWTAVSDCTLPANDVSFSVWLSQCLTSSTIGRKLQVIALCWSVWWWRNEVVWNNKVWQISYIVMEVQRLIYVWEGITAPTPSTIDNIAIPQNGVVWPEAVFLIYVDAIVVPDSDQVFFGCVVLDSNQNFIQPKMVQFSV